MIGAYDWAGGREAMLRFGPDAGPVVVVLQPFFEEANRTRALIATTLRALGELGVAGCLPDLPGTGDSRIPTEEVTLATMHMALTALIEAAKRPVFLASIRSGALVEVPAQGRWRFAPQEGSELLRELFRVKTASAREAGESFDSTALPDHPIELAGNLVSPALIAELRDAATDKEAPGLRTVRLETDAKPADAKFPGVPLWRRAEPDNDPVLARLLAEDIAAWVRACAA